MPLYAPSTPADAPYPAGLVVPLANAHGAGVAVGAADTLYLRRFLVRVAVTPASFGVRTTVGGAGSSFKVGVWREAAASRVPTGLPIMSNNVGEGTTASTTTDLATVSGVGMLPGVPFWIGLVFTGTLPTVVGVLNSDLDFAQSAGLGIGNSGAVTPQGYTIAQTYANDIAALNLTGASLSAFTGAGMPLPLMGT